MMSDRATTSKGVVITPKAAPELKVLAVLLTGFSLYSVLGALFCAYVGAPVGWATLFSLTGFFASVAFLTCFFCAFSSLFPTGRSIVIPRMGFDLFLLVGSLVGVAFIGLDRIVYRGVDIFGLSFAEIRVRLNAESGDDGISSVFSLVGNLFQILYLIVVSRLVFFWEEYASLSLFRAVGLILLTMAGLLSSSYLLGGRTLLLLFIFISVGAMLVRVCFGRTMVPVRFPKWWLLIGAVASFLLSVAVFWVRSRMGGRSIDSAVYLERLLAHLHPSVADFSGVAVGSPGIVGDLVNFSLCVFAYIFHQIWVFEAILVDGSAEGVALLAGLRAVIPGGFGVEGISSQFHGLFLPAPAALYYDFGFLGLAVGGGAISLFIFLSIVFFKHIRGGVAVFFPSFFMSAALISPICFIFNIPYAVIVFFSGVAIALVGLVVRAFALAAASAVREAKR